MKRKVPHKQCQNVRVLPLYMSCPLVTCVVDKHADILIISGFTAMNHCTLAILWFL